MSWRDYVSSNGRATPSEKAALQRRVDRLSTRSTGGEVWSAPEGERTPELNRQRAADAWGVRYGQEVHGVQHAGDEGLQAAGDRIETLTGSRPDFAELNALRPGTPEFNARYIPAPEEVETLAPYGAEGIAVIARGETMLDTPEPIPLEGPGPIIHGR